ncbi:SAM-dependent DNA methyltransferase [Streptomyces sp. A0958]|uniref:Eco57I restriction-modification methylase domain-containing protein n=1 Tax=Streptomyces sp. A0958 TaxID=2563101 RepID=UPI00109E6D9A|nr:DNA methyltransferase [Streptomyces sp. A0958]THA67086.1 SAM-dependent DNA methyltransferase [Streptomyces sp. A0958]
MSATTRSQGFAAVRPVGALLPADMLARISEATDVTGCAPVDYGLTTSRSVRDEAERGWKYLKPLWRELRGRLPEPPRAGAPATTTSPGPATADWPAPLWRALGFGPLTEVGPAGIAADSGAAKTFPVSHRWHHAVIHQTAWGHGLDTRRAGQVPPHSLVQECLNRTDAHLWGLLTNGRHVRLLRGSGAPAPASYVEFDLEAIFDGELLGEFTLLYRLLHVSRFEVAPGAAPSTCRLETWRTEAIASRARTLDQLCKGVRAALTTLGTGFLRHPANAALRAGTDAGALHNALLRLVYRLLFVFVAEDRDALLSPDASAAARSRYETYFSSARLRAHARERRGTEQSGDLYETLRLVLDALGDENGRPELGLPGLGGIFDATETDAPLHSLSLSDEHLLTAVHHLSQLRDTGSGRRRAVDYRHLGAEELGSVYESLLELVPRLGPADRTFELVELPGNTRKTTGSYYTPSSLIEYLLDSTLDPVLDAAVERGERAAAAADVADPSHAVVRELLALTVCDPACGSGHFLVAAARRIAKRVAAVREDNPEPTPGAVRHALHEVVAHCVYGVDLNPMAVELAKVSLWLEALEPGRPLGFLDAHLKHGNALIGATPSLLRGGIPDAAFKPLAGDDRTYARALAKRNRAEHGGPGRPFGQDAEPRTANTALATDLRGIVDAASGTLAEVHGQEAAYRGLAGSARYVRARHVADAWCAAFMWRKADGAPSAVTEKVFRNLQDPASDAVPQSTHDEIMRLRRRHRFFHWHLEFPEVFAVPESGEGVDAGTGWAGGFACVLGNPPWERIKLQEQEFFAQRDAEIAAAKTAAARKRLIAALKEDADGAGLHHAEFEVAKRRAEGESHFLRNAGRYPLTGRGDINTYAVFAETGRALTGPRGRMGVIVPTGIATDATTQFFFKDLVLKGAIAALYDFENAAPVFPDVHRSFKFSILSLTGRALREPAARFAFFLHDPAELDDKRRVFALTPEEITLLNPNTGTCPVFRSRRDAEITLGIYGRVPVLIKEGDPDGNPWGVTFGTMFHMSNDSHLFHTREELTVTGWQPSGNTFVKPDRADRADQADRADRAGKAMLPLYEAKMVDAYNHRAADVVKSATAVKRQNQPSYLSADDRSSASRLAVPGSWVDSAETPHDAPPGWLAFLRISSPTNQRTMISAILPPAAIGDSVFLLRTRTSRDSAALVAHFNSFVYDFVTRQKVAGLNLNFFYIRQLPVLLPETARRFTHFLIPRVLELTYTAHDMRPFATDLGDTGTPFRWDEARRRQIRAELDALFFHLYGIARDDVGHILDTFPIVRRKDEARYGTYRTKDLILAEYDRMTTAGLVEGGTYTSPLSPPPGEGARHPAGGPALPAVTSASTR